VIPAVFDEREIRAWLAGEDGSFRPAAPALELPDSVHSLEPGPAGLPAVAVTDDGLAALRLFTGADGPQLELQPVLTEPTVLAGTREFLAALSVVHDLDGDGDLDVLLPAADGLAVHLAGADGLVALPASRPLFGPVKPEGFTWPSVQDLDGDARPELVAQGPNRTHVLRGTGEGRFAPLRTASADCHDTGTELRFADSPPDALPWPDGLAALVDLDGDGRAEVVRIEELDRPGEGFFSEMKDAKRPHQRVRLHRLRPDLSVERAPYLESEVEGHVAQGEGPIEMEAFVDLDGDRHMELVTFTLDFSLLQAVRVLATKRISVGVDFHVYRQGASGAFEAVSGLDLSEKLKFDLDDLALRRFAQFAGDFDGDGRREFVHFGRGSKLTLHRGAAGCRYPSKPDLTIELAEEAASLDLVRVEDLDGDGRADIRILRPLPSTDPDESPPVKLDLYLSGAIQ